MLLLLFHIYESFFQIKFCALESRHNHRRPDSPPISSSILPFSFFLSFSACFSVPPLHFQFFLFSFLFSKFWLFLNCSSFLFISYVIFYNYPPPSSPLQLCFTLTSASPIPAPSFSCLPSCVLRHFVLLPKFSPAPRGPSKFWPSFEDPCKPPAP